MNLKSAIASVILVQLLACMPVVAREMCEPFPSPPAVVQHGPPKPKWDPKQFTPLRGGLAGTPLVFVGDSLTTGAGDKLASYPVVLSDDALGRTYEVFALAGQTSTKLADLFGEVPNPATDAVGIIWVGRNNIEQPEQVAADAGRIASRFASRRFLVISVLKGRWQSDQPGRPGDIQIDAVNEQLRKRFPANYVDLNDTIGCDDFKDNTHPNDQGNERIANAVLGALALRGW